MQQKNELEGSTNSALSDLDLMEIVQSRIGGDNNDDQVDKCDSFGLLGVESLQKMEGPNGGGEIVTLKKKSPKADVPNGKTVPTRTAESPHGQEQGRKGILFFAKGCINGAAQTKKSDVPAKTTTAAPPPLLQPLPRKRQPDEADEEPQRRVVGNVEHVPEMPSLRREERGGGVVGAESVPGAYGVLGSSSERRVLGVSRRSPTDIAAADEDEESLVVGGDVEAGTPRNDDGLAVANLIEDPTTRQEAEEVGFAAGSSSNSKANQKTSEDEGVVMRRWFCIGLAILVGGILLWVGYVVGKGSNNNTKSTDKDQEELNTIGLGNGPTDGAATTTMSHTSKPKDEIVLSLLPDYTLRELQDPDSPQSQAFQWLIDDPRFMQHTESRLMERYALATFYYATAGTEWNFNSNWLSYDHDECLWWTNPTFAESLFTGISYSSSSFVCLPSKDDGYYYFDCQEMEHLWLDANNLEGNIPLEFYLLTSLKSISLAANNMLRGSEGGRISSHIGQLSNLTAVNLPNLELQGTIPTEMSLLSSSLTYLNIESNTLTGGLPTQLGLLTQLNYLILGQNPLMGTVASELGNLNNLLWLYIFRNELTGTIPSELGKMAAVEEIALRQNQLSGKMPSELGLLSNMTILAPWSNTLTGTIPLEYFTQLESLTHLTVMKNQLTGTIASELALMPKLWSLFLGDNQLTGTLPEIGNNNGQGLQDLTELRLGNNKLTGSIPSSLVNLPSLTMVHLQENNLTGPIPHELGLMESSTNKSVFRNFNVADNQLSGSVPDGLCTIPEHTTGCHRRFKCVLTFDCSNELCGCGCSCSHNSTI